MNQQSDARLNTDDAQDLKEILILLALGSAVIASPGTPPLLAQVIAVMMQNTAMAWADLLATEAQDLGGAM
ncbi:hypothetical protein [Pseudomonas cichorii]|uniref:Uncharacterized protein n=1 Tax=Pseudomonas cichorii TaxID=36746 RepID=A0ABQ1DTM0_PSECI|nr:hypothetical protein [Pseudomonas cichorii]AHF66014.1 hypothetical protein PCH70_08610 [Pseudomonas cichorii JBC1]QVE17980.1 hypothetical protein KGD89_04265 [Pseudomonas cichorii]GFM94167.1 hypothetical protein PSCICP_41390 [Pseudomonas cichorii]SDP00302.1 hypothetical protein SAMN05216599_116130 [Pseudomonas cichorii]